MTLFSKRYARALQERRLSVSLPRRLRARVWSEISRRNESFSYQPDASDPWTERSDLLEELENDLKREYGAESLLGYIQNDEREPCTLQEFLEGGWPTQVLDAIEQYFTILGKASRAKDSNQQFQSEVNRIFSEEAAPWRLSEGQFFQVDTEFMAAHLESTEQILQRQGFSGALAELREARNDLTAGDTKGSIVNSCKAFESAMKTVLGTESGNASTLIRRMKGEGHLDDLPESARSSVSEQVLMSLPTLRNRLGGHGQGEEVVEVPRRYAELAVSLAASFITFCVEINASRESLPLSTSSSEQSLPEDPWSDPPPF
jgi:hypothetical protein